MLKILDDTKAVEIGLEIIPLLEDAGYAIEEAIPGLIQAIIELADRSGKAKEALLDEAANFLADGGATWDDF